MKSDSLLLAESLPHTILSALGELPKRLLFRNDCVQLVLVGLRAGQELNTFEPLCSLLMVVTFGRIMVRENGHNTKLLEGDQYRINSDGCYTVRALETTDLLFFIPAGPIQNRLPDETTEPVWQTTPCLAAA